MGIFGNLFKTKKIVRVEIVSIEEGISESDQLMNYAVGHMMGGFDGMVHASLLNESEGAKTTFKIVYDDGSVKYRKVNNGSSEYNKYIQYL